MMRNAGRILGEPARQKVACETGLLLNEAIRELLIPQHLDELFRRLHDGKAVSERYAAAVSHFSMMSVIMALYRLSEAQRDFLPWVFPEDETKALGLGPIEEFVRDWSAFIIVRGQYVGHARRKDSKGKEPGQVLPARTLGEALRKTGMWDSDDFLLRVRQELVPGVERVRDELFKRFPGVKEFVETIYGEDVRVVAEGRQ